MRVPAILKIGNELHALTRKLVAEIFISCVATLCAMIVFSNFNKPAPAPNAEQTRLASVDARFAKGEASEAIDDFVEQVALSHVAALKAASSPANARSGDAASNDAAFAPTPPPPRQAAAPRHDRPRADKTHVAANSPKAAPAAQAALPASEPAAAPQRADIDWLAPLHYGKLLVASAGDFVAASDARVIEGMASVGDALTSFTKKLHL